MMVDGSEAGGVDLHMIYMPTMNHLYTVVLLSYEPLPQSACRHAMGQEPSQYIHATVPRKHCQGYDTTWSDRKWHEM